MLSTPALSPSERELVAKMWAFRARSENQAAARFVRLAERLEAQELPEALQARARASIADERRHRARCAALAEDYGHPPLAGELVEGEVPEVAPPSLPPRRRLSYEIVAFCCLTESINAALLTRSYAEARVPAAREAIREILADEIQHARLGWAYLGRERDRAWLAEFFPTMLAATVPEELRDPRIQDAPSPGLRAHGVFEREELRAILLDTVEGVLVPGFELLGVDPEPIRAWMRAPALV